MERAGNKESLTKAYKFQPMKLVKYLSSRSQSTKLVRAAWVVSKKEIKLKLDTKNWATHSHDAKVDVDVGVGSVGDTRRHRRRRRHCSQPRCSLDFQLDRDLGSFPVQLPFSTNGLACIDPNRTSSDPAEA